MGQFRPAWGRGTRVPSPFLGFAVGFIMSSTSSFCLVHMAGAAAGLHPPGRLHETILIGGLVAVLLGEIATVSRGSVCSFGLRRQTPRRLGFLRGGTFLWGLDTGIPLSTVRLTALPVLGVLLTGLGYGGKLTGLAYASGFLGALVYMCLKSPVANQSREPDAIAVLRVLSARTMTVRRVGLLAVFASTAIVAAQVVG